MIYIDTGPLLARYLARDQHHREAVGAWSQLTTSPQQLFTSNLVIAEWITLLARRADAGFAAARARNLYASPRLTILRPDSAEETAALAILERHAGEPASFTDCVSFVLMRRHRVRRAFTFDGHFEVAGFEKWP